MEKRVMGKNLSSPTRELRKGFLWIASDAFDALLPLIQPTTFLVYVALCRWADNETQSCYPSQDKIAEAIGVTTRTVKTCIQELLAIGAISIEKLGRKNSYCLLQIGENFSPIGKQQGKPSVKNRGSGLPPNYTKELNSNISDSAESVPSLLFEDSSLSEKEKTKPPKQPDERHQPFKEKLIKFWKWLNGSELRWDVSEAAQLSAFLKKWPELTLSSFHDALYNYAESENIVKTQTPRQFLSKLNLYFDSPLNKYGKPNGLEKHA
jgi:Helix-turn-helix domain